MKAPRQNLLPQKSQTEQFFSYLVVGTNITVFYSKSLNVLTVLMGNIFVFSKYAFALDYETFLEFSKGIMKDYLNTTNLN